MTAFGLSAWEYVLRYWDGFAGMQDAGIKDGLTDMALPNGHGI